jgi:hypothetical protein
MTASESTGFGRQESVAQTPRVTATIRRTANGETIPEYRHGGRTYYCLDSLERAITGDINGPAGDDL